MAGKEYLKIWFDVSGNFYKVDTLDREEGNFINVRTGEKSRILLSELIQLSLEQTHKFLILEGDNVKTFYDIDHFNDVLVEKLKTKMHLNVEKSR